MFYLFKESLIQVIDFNGGAQSYKECAAFTEQQENLLDADSELEKFFASRTFQNVIKEISRRLRFKKKLKKHDVLKMYDMCRYEQAWNKNATSIWCLVSVIHKFCMHSMKSDKSIHSFFVVVYITRIESTGIRK